MNANTNINVLGGILDAMLANLTEHIDKRVEAKVFTLTERIERLETDLTVALLALTERIEKLEEQVGSLMNCQDNDQMENARRITELEEKAAQNPTLGVAAMDLTSEQFRDAVKEIADKAVESHCEEYDHDLIHEEEDTEDAVDTALRQALRNARIELR